MPQETSSVLLYEKKDKIVTITLNRPKQRNALNTELWEKLAMAWEKFRDDDDAWVAIITGAGDKALCSGQDLVEYAKLKKEGVDRSKTSFLPFNDRLYLFERVFCPEIWKPIICGINGDAVAGGFYLAQSCDIRIAADHARLGISETKWNLPAAWVCTLTREMTMGHALELALWGDKTITAQRGYEMGWINKVVPYSKLMDECMEWAERMLYLAPRCVRNLKEILYRSYNMSPHQALAYAVRQEANLVGMEDTYEGSVAFAEKRKPVFKNR